MAGLYFACGAHTAWSQSMVRAAVSPQHAARTRRGFYSQSSPIAVGSGSWFLLTTTPTTQNRALVTPEPAGARVVRARALPAHAEVGRAAARYFARAQQLESFAPFPLGGRLSDGRGLVEGLVAVLMREVPRLREHVCSRQKGNVVLQLEGFPPFPLGQCRCGWGGMHRGDHGGVRRDVGGGVNGGVDVGVGGGVNAEVCGLRGACSSWPAPAQAP